jgi:hypothetical protein
MAGRAGIAPLHFAALSAFNEQHENRLLAGLAARWKSRRGYLTASWHCEQNGNIDGESSCNSVKKVDGNIVVASLDTTDRRAVDASVHGKVLLRDLLVGTYLPQIPSNATTRIHNRMAIILKRLNPSDISDIFLFRRELCVVRGVHMKIAVGIIGMFLGLLVLLQSCTVAAGSGLLQDKATSGAGAIGMLVGVLFFIAGAFSFGLPLVAAVIFAVAGLFAFLAATQGTFGDITIWGVVALVLALMAFFAWRSGRKKKQVQA